MNDAFVAGTHLLLKVALAAILSSDLREGTSASNEWNEVTKKLLMSNFKYLR